MAKGVMSINSLTMLAGAVVFSLDGLLDEFESVTGIYIAMGVIIPILTLLQLLMISSLLSSMKKHPYDCTEKRQVCVCDFKWTEEHMHVPSYIFLLLDPFPPLSLFCLSAINPTGYVVWTFIYGSDLRSTHLPHLRRGFYDRWLDPRWSHHEQHLCLVSLYLLHLQEEPHDPLCQSSYSSSGADNPSGRSWIHDRFPGHPYTLGPRLIGDLNNKRRACPLVENNEHSSSSSTPSLPLPPCFIVWILPFTLMF